LGVERSKLYLNRETSLDPSALERFNSLVSRRMSGEPVAYITGRREFWSLEFLVTPAVLVPRPETELLVEVAVRRVADEFRIVGRKLRVLDLGTGSGAIAVALAKEIGGGEIWATDISPDAIEIARANARRHGVEEKIHFLAGDLFEPVNDHTDFFDVIVSNPPYVRRVEFVALPRDVRDFEPRIALDGGADGLDFYRRIVGQAARHLTVRGFVALEIGADMGGEAARLFAEAGCYTPARIERDCAVRDRVISARKLA
jgi:release factor glutamine methyltransferase